MAQKTYRVGVIGRTGRGDYGHDLDLAWLAIPETTIVAVADEDPAGLAAAGERLGVAARYADWRKMLDDERPDIVCIAPRWLDCHHEMAMEAAGRGMHIYMEKPLTPALAQADELIDVCERTHARLVVAHPTRYSPRLARIKALMEAGRFGKVLEYRGRGKEDARGGGEDLWVLGTHVMDMIIALGGAPQWCFARVTQEGEPVSAEHVAPGNEGIGLLAGDAVHAMYGMPDGSTAYFSSVKGVAANPTRHGLQVYCSHGVVEIMEGTMPPTSCLRDRGWSPLRSGAEWMHVTSAGWDQPEPLVGPEYESRHTLAIRDLIASIEEQREPLGGMYAARSAVEMIAAVFESHRQGKPVSLPLEVRENPLALLQQAPA